MLGQRRRQWAAIKQHWHNASTLENSVKVDLFTLQNIITMITIIMSILIKKIVLSN